MYFQVRTISVTILYKMALANGCLTVKAKVSEAGVCGMLLREVLSDVEVC